MKRKQVLSAALCAALMGGAIAQQVNVSSSVSNASGIYLLDVDTARYAGPAGQRLALRLGDSPRHFRIGQNDEICVQLERDSQRADVINAKVRTLRPEEQQAEVRVVAPDISPGTFRSTPWGLLLRAVPEKAQRATAEDDVAPAQAAPVCTI